MLSPSIWNERTNLFPSLLHSYSYLHGIHSIVSRLYPLASRRCVFSDAGPLLDWSSSNATNRGLWFISSALAPRYSPHPKSETTYSLLNFYASRNKEIYRKEVRFHSHEDIQGSQLRGDHYDVVDHLKLVNGQSLNDCSILDEVEIATTCRFLVHLQSKGLQKISISSSHPVIKVNTKRLAGNLALTSVSSSRVFIDKVVQLTIAYFSWFSSNPGIATLVNAEEVTKAERLSQ
ncbi:hypothetical protein HID58_012054 [Brassica napus]|uniref:Uncharacterized protein n=1 Tax=Brassica napus TaxID=3708 RepID=A0ABQ8DZY6_BRANA|nr:hypothetical protein HID58_012054 [Brassica napus]